ncbi:competence protein F homolog [alpha proteobacterium U9-1i]|nr:competence protein F homolog [alpha proteobacterium U9-1i]
MAQSYRASATFRKRGLVSRLSDLIWPPRSLLSDAIVDRPGVIEPPLWSELQFLSGAGCFRCGFPLQEEPGAEGVCGACAGRAPAYDCARAALAYDDHARRLILDLKRGGRRDGLPVFARWMGQAGGDIIARADFIAPAPMHWTRLAVRSFNQAAWLAQAISHASGKPWRPEALKRVKRRKSQAGLSASERRRNVAGAIKAGAKLQGQTVLVVDDVFTTGATLEACARALKRAGAAEVHGLTLARVVRPLDIHV